MSRARRLLGALVTAAAVALALVALGGRNEGTVVDKTHDVTGDYVCRAGGTVTGPVAFPQWGACADPGCWRLTIRDGDGTTSGHCVSRAEYDRTPVGAFWHGRTDR